MKTGTTTKINHIDLNQPASFPLIGSNEVPWSKAAGPGTCLQIISFEPAQRLLSAPIKALHGKFGHGDIFLAVGAWEEPVRFRGEGFVPVVRKFSTPVAPNQMLPAPKGSREAAPNCSRHAQATFLVSNQWAFLWKLLRCNLMLEVQQELLRLGLQTLQRSHQDIHACSVIY